MGVGQTEQCEYGAVRFVAKTARPGVMFCHCSQCRRSSGHFWAATRCDYSDLTFLSDLGLRWYASSNFAKRGFCERCGSSLFYRMNAEAGISIAAGCNDGSNDLRSGRHIFTGDKGTYYEIAQDAPHIVKY